MNRKTNPSAASTAALALELHGADYFRHLDRVRNYFLEFTALLPAGILTLEDIDDGEAAALLHDSIEDGYTTEEKLARRGYRRRILDLILGLTRDPSKETYHDKMVRTAATGDIVLIMAKLADNRDNSTPWRIAELPPERRSLLDRYLRARRTLFDGLATVLRARGVADDIIDNIEQWLGNQDPSQQW